MFDKLNNLFRKEKTLDSILSKSGVSEEQLASLGTASIEIEVDESKRSLLKEMPLENIQIEEGPKQLLGLVTVSYIASVITIIQALVWIENKVGSNVKLTIKTTDGQSQKVSIHGAINYYINKARNNNG